jgi:hypothetical protein
VAEATLLVGLGGDGLGDLALQAGEVATAGANGFRKDVHLPQ